MTPESPTQLVEAQRHYFADGKTREIGARLDALQRLSGALESREDELLAALASDLGKPEFEAFFAESHFLRQELSLFLRSLRKWLKPRSAKSPPYFWPCRNQIRLEPRGVTVVIGPWNYPIQLSLAPLIASIAAGNTVILKPSELTPACEKFLSSLITDCFPPEHAAVITGGPDLAEDLLKQQTDFIFFTGSTKVGRIVARHAAEHLTPTILELGGKCPCVVDKSADLTITARRILIGKLFNAGQTCFAPDFVIAHQEIKDALVTELTAALEQFPWETDMAHIINRDHYDRLQTLLGEPAVTKGSDNPANLHFAPRLLPAATWDSPAMQDEIFGPILPILSFNNPADLFAALKPLPSPLALYSFSKDEHFTRSLLQTIPSGGATLNDIGKHASNLHMPFGGVGNSGHGRYRGKFGLEAFSYQRALTRRYFLPDPFEPLPPRAKMTRLLRKFLS